MRVSVAICTWNRAGLLAQTLEAMTRLRVPADLSWELLVVNNGCTDPTDEVLQQYATRLPLRRCWEPVLGLSHARNRAVAEARGDYLVWTDDDVLVNEDWLTEYCRAFDRWPEAAVFGGPVAPWFAGTPPQWLVQVFPRVASAFAAIDLGDQAVPLDPEGSLPFGANMAIRMREQRSHRFDASLGVRGSQRGAAEETCLIQSILRDGAAGWWVPAARVRHYIPTERQTTTYLRRHYFAYGRVCARQWQGGEEKKWFGRPRWLWRHALERELCYRVRRVVGRPAEWVEELVRASMAWGRLRDLGRLPRHDTATAAVESAC